MTEHQTTQRLDLTEAAGLWCVRGVSGTSYVIDADHGVALRQPAEGASTGAYDGCWMTLVAVNNIEGPGVVVVGLRHRWDFDPAPGEPGYTIWWIQTAVESIEPLSLDERPEGREAAPDECRNPFRPAGGR